MERPGRSARPPSSWPSTAAPRSPLSATAPTSRSWRSLGADEVIDHTIEDFATNGLTYDIVLDAVGKKSFAECKGSLEVGGSYVSTDLGPHSQNVPLMVWTRFIGKKKAMMPIPRYTKDKVERIKELVETGAYRAVIDRTYPLDDAAEATRYVETRAEDRQHRAHRQVSVTSPAAGHGGATDAVRIVEVRLLTHEVASSRRRATRVRTDRSGTCGCGGRPDPT